LRRDLVFAILPIRQTRIAMMRFHGWSLLGVAVLIAGCNDEPSSVPRPEIDQTHRQIVEQSNKLALALYGDLRKNPGNLVLSPYGVSASLAMLLAGADGPTRKEIHTALAISYNEEHAFHAAQGELLRWLSADDDARPHRLNIASAIFTQHDQDPLIAFVKLLEAHYAAQPHLVDFVSQPATARKVINDWAAEKTRDKISEVVAPDEVNTQTRLVLASAVYFKGQWDQAFDPSRTEPAAFYLTADDKIDVPMMHQSPRFAYGQQDGVRILIMPYRGDELSMALFLPDKIDGLSALEEQLDVAALSRWLDSAAENVVRLPVSIPKFKFDDSNDVEAALKRLGMLTTFDPTAADLSRIDGVRPTAANAGDRLFVDRIRQRAMIEVNEEGTEAAAVTTIAKTETSKEPRDAPKFHADHPFLFLIRENSTGLILFLGRVVDPSKG
jgi:serpin B